jgi:hypothetical protein
MSAYWLRQALIELGPCVVCGAPGEEMHHSDYRDSINVEWYCRKHHAQFHSHHGLEPLNWQKDAREAIARMGAARVNAELRRLMPDSKITLATTLQALFDLTLQRGGDLELDSMRFRLRLKIAA